MAAWANVKLQAQRADAALDIIVRDIRQKWQLGPHDNPMQHLLDITLTLGGPTEDNPLFLDAESNGVAAALPHLASAVPKAAIALSIMCEVGQGFTQDPVAMRILVGLGALLELLWFSTTSCRMLRAADAAPVQDATNRLLNQLTSPDLINATTQAARFALDVAAPNRRPLPGSALPPPPGPQGQRTRAAGSVAGGRGMPSIAAADLCQPNAAFLFFNLAGFTWELLQAVCSMPPHMGAILPPEQRRMLAASSPGRAALATRLEAALHSSSLIPMLCCILLDFPKPPEQGLFVGFGAFEPAPPSEAVDSDITIATYILFSLVGVCQLHDDCTAVAKGGAKGAATAAASRKGAAKEDEASRLLSAPEVRLMLSSLLEIVIEDGLYGSGDDDGQKYGRGSGGPKRSSSSSTGASSSSNKEGAAFCARLRWAAAHPEALASKVANLHGHVIQTSRMLWDRKPDLQPASAAAHARLCRRLMHAACRLHRGLGRGGLPARPITDPDDAFFPSCGVSPLLSHVWVMCEPVLRELGTSLQTMLRGPADASGIRYPAVPDVPGVPGVGSGGAGRGGGGGGSGGVSSRLGSSGLVDAWEAMAWWLGVIAEQGSMARRGGMLEGSISPPWDEGVNEMLYMWSNWFGNGATGWPALDRALRDDLLRRFARADLLASFDAVLRVLATHGSADCAMRAATCIAEPLLPLMLPLLLGRLDTMASKTSPGSSSSSGGIGSAGAGADPRDFTRDLGVLVTAAKLTMRELSRLEETQLGQQQQGQQRQGQAESAPRGPKSLKPEDLQTAGSLFQPVVVGASSTHGLPLLLLRQQDLPPGSLAHAAAAEALGMCARAAFRFAPMQLHMAVRAAAAEAAGRRRHAAAAAAAFPLPRGYYVSAALRSTATCLHALPACVANLPPSFVVSELQPGRVLAGLGHLLHHLAPAAEPDTRSESNLRVGVALTVRVAMSSLAAAAAPELRDYARRLLIECGVTEDEKIGEGQAPPPLTAAEVKKLQEEECGRPPLDIRALVVRLRGWAELEADAVELLRRAAGCRSDTMLARVARMMPQQGADSGAATPLMTGNKLAEIAMVLCNISPGGNAAPAAAAPPPPLPLPPAQRRLGLLKVCGNPQCGNFGGRCEAELPMQHCSGCCAVRYCGEACQRAHWRSGHKRRCKELAAAARQAEG